MELILQPCDIFFTRGPGFVSAAIRFFTRTLGEARTKVNHVGIIVEGGPPECAMSIEAVDRVRKRSFWQAYANTKQEVAVYRPKNLTPDEKAAILKEAESYVGRGYSYFKIATQLADWLLFGAYVFRRLTQSTKIVDCSFSVAKWFGAAGKNFGVPAGMASPDDEWDFVNAHLDKYECVYPLGRIK